MRKFATGVILTMALLSVERVDSFNINIDNCGSSVTMTDGDSQDAEGDLCTA